MAWFRSEGVGTAELFATGAGRSIYERRGFRDHEYPAMRARLQ